MSVLEQALQNQAEQNNKNKNLKKTDEDEFMDLYAEKKANKYINQEKSSVFYEGALNTVRGINTEFSIFDKNCIFKTEKE